MAVFSSELANLLLPKNPGKFSSDLQQTLLKREQVAQLGQVMQKWILGYKPDTVSPTNDSNN